jgi:raffinose/stachyose/melibiose transport system permease protein
MATLTPVAPGVAPGAGRPIRRGAGLAIVAFLLPALALYLVFVLLPIFQGAYYSLFKWNGLQPLTNFVGLGNYQKAIGTTLFVASVGHNAMIIVLSLCLQIPFSLALAVYLNARFPGRAILRVIFFLPYVISEVITAIMFYLLLQPDGAVNSVLRWAGLGSLAQDWFGDLGLVMLTMFVVISWKYFGFHMILLLAGLQGIPHELSDAALIDGAGRWQSFRYVTFPLLGPTLRVSVFLSIIGALQLFDIVWATTRGGPLHASDTMATYMYDFGFQRSQMGYGSAVAVILFSLCLIFALFYQRFVLRRDTEGAITTVAG